jgi:hypothetical protein
MTLRRSLAAALVLAAGTVVSPLLADTGYSPFRLTVLVDGSPAPEYSARGRIYIEALKGRTFSVRITNPTSERIAVALSVDGRNVIDAKRTTSLAAAKWILSPGETAEIPGWQISGDTSRRFFFTETQHSYAKWLGDTSNTGVIEAVFYREKHAVAVAPHPRHWWEWESKDEAERNSRSGQGLGSPGAPMPESRAQSAPEPDAEKSREAVTVTGEAPLVDGSDTRSRDAARQRPEAGAIQKKSEAYAATGIGERTSFPIQWTTFDEDPTPAARVSLRYEFHAELVRLGVLPREDDLYARDRGRGFEREYAPDPYARVR